MPAPIRHRAVLFDLDGTLLDTLDDIANAANSVLLARGFPTHPNGDYRRFIGDGVAVLFRRALPAGAGADDVVAGCVAEFGTVYDRSWHATTRFYDGMPGLLDALAARGLALGVLSNKPHAFTVQMVAHYLGRWPMRAVFGAREGIPRKPDPAGAFEAAEALGVPPDAVLYVGDSAVDMETARRAGMDPVGVSWGFRPVDELRAAGARAVIDRPLELIDLIVG